METAKERRGIYRAARTSGGREEPKEGWSLGTARGGVESCGKVIRTAGFIVLFIPSHTITLMTRSKPGSDLSSPRGPHPLADPFHLLATAQR